jgi:Ca2+-transporting ATPase
LAIAAVVSLAVGLYDDIAQPEYDENGNKMAGVKWVEGVAIIVAIVIVILVGSVNDFQKERQFQKLNAKKEDRLVKVN